jgi:prophage antirepressor-like protein
MNQLQIFDYEENEIRTVKIDGEPWWVLKDVCNALGIENASDVAAKQFDDDELEKTYVGVQTGTKADGSPAIQEKEVHIISESGLYTLIIRSNKPEAKPFRRWVTHEVIPAIRKTGKYDMNRSTAIESSLSRIEANINFARPIRAEVISLIKDGMSQDAAMKYVDSIIVQEEQQSGIDLSWLKSTNLTPEAPKLELKLYTTGQIANEYHFDACNLRYLLIEHGLLRYITKFNGAYGKYMPTEKAINECLAVTQYDTDEHHPQVFWTAKGRDIIDDLVNSH